jgi:hypothetical protein
MTGDGTELREGPTMVNANRGGKLVLSMAALLAGAAPARAQPVIDSAALSDTRVRVYVGQPPSLRVKGRVIALTPDSLVVNADPLPRMVPTREAIARSEVTGLELSRPNYRVASALAVILALPGAYVIALSPVGSPAGYVATGIGGLLGFALGRTVSPTRWARVSLSAGVHQRP